MNLNLKLAAFDYVVFKLTEWYNEKHENWQIENDLSRLKITKLLFFVTASSATSKEKGLLSVFDRFAALPYGHVESQIQDNITRSEVYDISRFSLRFKPGIDDYTVSELITEDLKNQLDSAFHILKSKNESLINYGAFELVDLSHRWQSWTTVFAIAKKNGKLSMEIPVTMIMNETKIFK